MANCFLICSVNSLQCSVNSFQCPVNLSYVIIPLSIFIILELFLILFLASTLLAGATTYCVDITNDNRRTCIHDYTMICLQRLTLLPGIYLASRCSYCVYITRDNNRRTCIHDYTIVTDWSDYTKRGTTPLSSNQLLPSHVHTRMRTILDTNTLHSSLPIQNTILDNHTKD